MKRLRAMHPSSICGSKIKFEQAKKLLIRRSNICETVLSSALSMHPMHNAWEEVDFGDNPNGICSATIDDPMHFCEGGLMMYIAKSVFDSFTDTEKTSMEGLIKGMWKGNRSSCLLDFPRGHYATGFSNMSMITSGEKVGMMFSIMLALRGPHFPRKQ